MAAAISAPALANATPSAARESAVTAAPMSFWQDTTKKKPAAKPARTRMKVTKESRETVNRDSANAVLERARQDSLARIQQMRTDSINAAQAAAAQAERDRQAAIARAEQARRDSIARVEQMR
ncbi:MAG: hypothetical protein M3081_05885, partial [Gemmatimonadota bacterium]|nr:hypothetical protein [Gemmatimonadota bacterium]